MKEVRLVTSSVSLVLLLDLEDCPLKVPRTGEETVEDSTVVMKKKSYERV